MRYRSFNGRGFYGIDKSWQRKSKVSLAIGARAVQYIESDGAEKIWPSDEGAFVAGL